MQDFYVSYILSRDEIRFLIEGLTQTRPTPAAQEIIEQYLTEGPEASEKEQGGSLPDNVFLASGFSRLPTDAAQDAASRSVDDPWSEVKTSGGAPDEGESLDETVFETGVSPRVRPACAQTPHDKAESSPTNGFITLPSHPAESLVFKRLAKRSGSALYVEPVVVLLANSFLSAVSAEKEPYGLVIKTPKLYLLASNRDYNPHTWRITPFPNKQRLLEFVDEKSSDASGEDAVQTHEIRP